MSRLVELAEAALVEFTHTNEQGGPRMVTPTEILALMSRPGIERELSFKLTRAGGDTWESMAEPRWHDMDDGFATPRYENDKIAGWDWTLFSQNRDRLVAAMGRWPRFNDDQVNFDSITWTLTEDYEVKYWKHLRNVHVVTFQSSPRTRQCTESRPSGSHPGGQPSRLGTANLGRWKVGRRRMPRRKILIRWVSFRSNHPSSVSPLARPFW